AQEVTKSEDKWNIFINTLSLGPKGNKDGVIDNKEMYLAEYGADRELIDRYAKDLKTTTAFNKIQQEWTEKRLANPVMLSMRPAEVSSLQIINYKPDSEDLLAWYKAGYSWYCTGYAIKTGKMRDPVYTKTGKRNNMPFAKFIKSLKTNQDKDEITPEFLRKIGAKHALMVHASPNPTPQHLNNLSEIALRHKINRLDVGKNYALGDPESKEPISDSENTSSLVPQLKNDDYNPFKGQIAEIDSMLASF
ncbi:hypothetical protein C1645_830583, partial [Glomus cerebriforme]